MLYRSLRPLRSSSLILSYSFGSRISVSSVLPSTSLSSSFSSRSQSWLYSKRSFASSSYAHLSLSSPHPSTLVVSLARPDLHNAFNEHMIDEVTHVFNNIQPKNTRVVVLTGLGKSFSAGADLNWMAKMVNYSEKDNIIDSYKLFDMFKAIYNCQIPVIGKVNGAAMGGGCGLVAACDIAFAVKSALFGFTEVKLGLIPAVISPFVMEKIGKTNCSRFFLTGEKISAFDAKAIGLINQLCENDKELDQLVSKTVREISSSSPAAVTAAKLLLNNVNHKYNDINQTSTKEYVAEQIAKIRVSQEGQEGLHAFLRKGRPSWAPKE